MPPPPSAKIELKNNIPGLDLHGGCGEGDTLPWGVGMGGGGTPSRGGGGGGWGDTLPMPAVCFRVKLHVQPEIYNRRGDAPSIMSASHSVEFDLLGEKGDCDNFAFATPQSNY